MNVCVVGAGPAGSYAAYLLARQGHAVSVFEDHKEIGMPIQCTGIVTKALFDLVPYDDKYIVNKARSVLVHSSNASIEVPLDEYIICRHRFDKFVAEMATRSGVKYHLGHKFVSHTNNKAVFRHNGKETVHSFDILVGADGPLSKVAKSSRLYETQDCWIGCQATMKSKWVSDKFETWFGSDVAPGFFGWSVPESNVLSRVGVAGTNKARLFFEKLQKRVNGVIVSMTGGPIPIYKKRIVQNKNVFLVGDAGGFVKATTGGGIITGMLSSKALAESIQNNKPYEYYLRSLRRELWIHERIRKILNRFSDKDYDYLLWLMNKEKIKKILREHPREFPSRFILKLLLAEPRLLWFAKHMFLFYVLF
ncbi:NAD(P)/FAD-dependent oxidoreductase [Candidatus Woesearchaeota archaeon]|nr:NAD(P)/FAD-dependent oxidoreductase [Candidatus Woesearchaeota archaeon]